MSIHVRKTGSIASWVLIALVIVFVVSAYATHLYGLKP
jgi:hypothetical protein